MKRVIAIILALVCTTCSSHNDSISLKQDEQLVGVYQNAATNSVNNFYVQVEFVFYASQIKTYPVCTEAVRSALSEWSRRIPVCIITYIEDPTAISSFYGPDIWHNRLGVLQIIMTDLSLPPYNFSNDILGLFDANNHLILLDADFLENNPDIAYKTSLHEIGHLFGVPHVVNLKHNSLTGFILLPDAVDAEACVMFPAITNKPQNVLSDIEIEIATEYIKYVFSNKHYNNFKCILQQ